MTTKTIRERFEALHCFQNSEHGDLEMARDDVLALADEIDRERAPRPNLLSVGIARAKIVDLMTTDLYPLADETIVAALNEFERAVRDEETANGGQP